MNALKAVCVCINGALVLIEMFAHDSVPVVNVGESGLVDSGSGQQINHQSNYIP